MTNSQSTQPNEIIKIQIPKDQQADINESSNLFQHICMRYLCFIYLVIFVFSMQMEGQFYSFTLSISFFHFATEKEIAFHLLFNNHQSKTLIFICQNNSNFKILDYFTPSEHEDSSSKFHELCDQRFTSSFDDMLFRNIT